MFSRLHTLLEVSEDKLDVCFQNMELGVDNVEICAKISLSLLHEFYGLFNSRSTLLVLHSAQEALASQKEVATNTVTPNPV
jgi:hypothetical protein